MKPEISVYITVYNCENYISGAINSILNQSFTNFELIIINDGADDGTYKIINQYANTDNRIRAFHMERLGRGKALNLALSKSRCNYIANLDADDRSHPQRLAIMYRLIQDNPEFSILSSSSIVVTGSQEPIWKEINKDSINIKNVTKNIATQNPINHSSIIAKKDDIILCGGYSESRKFQLDYDLWVKMAYNNLKLGKINSKLNFQRFHKEQFFASRRTIKNSLHSTLFELKTLFILNGNKSHIFKIYVKFLWALVPPTIKHKYRILKYKDN